MAGDNGESFQTGYNTGVVSDPVSEAGATSRRLQEEANQLTVPQNSADPSLRVNVHEIAGSSLIARILTGAIISDIFWAIEKMADRLLSARATILLAVAVAAAVGLFAVANDVSAILGLTIPYETAVSAGAGFALPYIFLVILRQVAKSLAIVSSGLLNLAFSLAYMAFLAGLLIGGVYLLWILFRAS